MPAFSPRQFFQYISYLQYPILLVGLYFIVATMIQFDPELVSHEGTKDERLQLLFDLIAPGINIGLMFLGIALSLSTLQDPTKTQNKLSHVVWSDAKKGKIMLITMALTAALFLILSLMGLFLFPNSLLNELAFGILAIGIAYIGMLRVAIEMFEHHRTK